MSAKPYVREWNAAEKRWVRQLHEAGLTAAEIAARLTGRSPRQVRLLLEGWRHEARLKVAREAEERTLG